MILIDRCLQLQPRQDYGFKPYFSKIVVDSVPLYSPYGREAYLGTPLKPDQRLIAPNLLRLARLGHLKVNGLGLKNRMPRIFL
jgi:hypothetical protein